MGGGGYHSSSAQNISSETTYKPRKIEEEESFQCLSLFAKSIQTIRYFSLNL